MELTDIYLFNDDYKRGVVLLEATHDWDWACTDEVREWWGGYVDSAFSGRMLQMGDYTNIPFPLVFSQDICAATERGKRAGKSMASLTIAPSRWPTFPDSSSEGRVASLPQEGDRALYRQWERQRRV